MVSGVRRVTILPVTNLEVDNFDKHIEDTMIAGDFLSDREAVEKVVKGF